MNKKKKMKITDQYVRLHRDCLNEHGEVDAIIFSGRLFHCALCSIVPCPRTTIKKHAPLSSNCLHKN